MLNLEPQCQYGETAKEENDTDCDFSQEVCSYKQLLSRDSRTIPYFLKH